MSHTLSARAHPWQRFDNSIMVAAFLRLHVKPVLYSSPITPGRTSIALDTNRRRPNDERH